MLCIPVDLCRYDGMVSWSLGSARTPYTIASRGERKRWIQTSYCFIGLAILTSKRRNCAKSTGMPLEDAALNVATNYKCKSERSDCYSGVKYVNWISEWMNTFINVLICNFYLFGFLSGVSILHVLSSYKIHISPLRNYLYMSSVIDISLE